MKGRTKVKHLSKFEEAKAKWEAQQIQVLIDDDEVPGKAEVLELERVKQVLKSLDVPVKIIIDGKYYKIRLRQKVPYKKYKEILTQLQSLAHAHWSKEEKAILLSRYQIPETEVPEVPIIKVGAKG